MAENGDNLSSLNEKTLQNIQERLSKLEHVQGKTLQMVREIVDSVTGMSNQITAALEKVAKTQQLTGSRLSTIDQRLAAIEEHTGMARI